MIQFIAKIKATFARSSFEQAVRKPAQHQAQVWKQTLAAIQRGTFWSEQVASTELKDYPITDYSFYEKAIAADLAHNDHSRLTGEKIVFWAESSGTTGSIKHFPITGLYQSQFQKVNLPFASAVFAHDPHFFENSILYLAAPSAMDCTATGIEKGLISGYNYRNIPSLLAKKYALPNSFLTDPALYAKWATRYAMLSDVGTIFSIAPSKITAMLIEINRNREQYFKWIEEGCVIDEGMPQPRLTEARRLELMEVLGTPRDMKRKLMAQDIWARLRLIGCWKTGPCRFQLDELAEWVSRDVIRLDAMYTATEAWMTVPLDPAKDGGPIHPDAVLAEFIEEGQEIKVENLIPLTALEVGKTYEIFVTSLMGLIRYRMFDLVKCTGKYQQTPWIEFVQKSSQVISLGWTRVSESDLYSAFQEMKYLPDPSEKFLIASNSTGNGLQLLEFADPIAPFPTIDAEKFDLALQKVNAYYRTDRQKGVILALGVKQLSRKNRDQFYGRNHLQSKPGLLTRIALPGASGNVSAG